MVSTSQHAFVEGGQILEAILIAYEAIDSRLKSYNVEFILKVDIKKAYDHVNKAFLIVVLSKMGFG